MEGFMLRCGGLPEERYSQLLPAAPRTLLPLWNVLNKSSLNTAQVWKKLEVLKR
jgi:hypothetical protein